MFLKETDQLVTLLADEGDESIWLEVESCGILFQIPLSSVQAAIEAAAEDVHSERWHELNVPDYCEEGLSVAAKANLKGKVGNDT